MNLKKLSLVSLISIFVFSCDTNANQERITNEASKDSPTKNRNKNEDSKNMSKKNSVNLYEIEESNYCYSYNGEGEFYYTKTETGTISGKLTLNRDNIEGIFTGEFRNNILLGTLKYENEEGKRLAKEIVFLKNDSDHSLTEGIGKLEKVNQKMRLTDLKEVNFEGKKFYEVDCSQLKSYRGY